MSFFSFRSSDQCRAGSTYASFGIYDTVIFTSVQVSMAFIDEWQRIEL